MLHLAVMVLVQLWSRLPVIKKKTQNIITNHILKKKLFLDFAPLTLPALPAVSSSLVSRSLCHWHNRRCHVSRLLRYGKAGPHLALDRGACQPHTVIIPELTSPLSIELLRRWGGHKIPCSEKQHCSGPRGLWVKNECRCIKEKKNKKPPAADDTVLIS